MGLSISNGSKNGQLYQVYRSNGGIELNKKVAVNYMYNLTYQILAIFLPFITTPYISRVLRPEGVGIFNFTYSMVSIFVLVASLGSHAYAQREIAFSGTNKHNISETFWSIFSIRIVSSLVVTVFYLMLIIINKNYLYIYIIEYLCILANMIDISWLFQGMGDFKKTAIRSIFVKAFSTIAIFAFVKTENDLAIYTFICAFSTFLNASVLWGYAPKVLEKSKIHWLSVKRHIKPIFMFFLPMIAIHVYTNVDKVFLGWISTEEEVGYYSQAEKIIKLSMTIITSLGTVLLPQIASLIKEREMESVKNQVKNAIHFVFVLGFPMVIGIICIASLFVPWFFGNGYEPCILIMQVLSVLILVIGLSGVTGQAVLIPLDRQKIYTVSIICGMIVNVVTNIIFIPVFNSMGAVIGSIVAEFLVGIIQQVVVLKELKLRISEELKDNVACVVSGCIMGIGLVLVKHLFVSSLLSLFFYSCIGVLIYGICMIIFRDRFIIQIFNRFKKQEL